MEGQYNMRSPAVKRLMKEAQELSEPTEQYYAQPLEDNLFEWHFTIRGPAESDFNEGTYHGRIILPPEYPMKPPSIILLTPNGRFEVNKKICLSISGHHPESWQPSWSIRTALLAIIGFMPTHGGGAIGSLNYTPEERKVLARRSQAWRCPRCGSVSSVLKPVTEESEETRKEAQELASQIDFKGENKKLDQASSSAPSQSQEVPSSTSPSVQPASTPTSPAQANGAVGGAMPASLLAYYSPLMAGVYPGQAMPGRFPLPSQLYSQGGLGSSGMMFPLPLNPYAHVPMYPHGFPWPPPPTAYPPPIGPVPFYAPGMPAAAVPPTAASSTPASSPAQPTPPSQGVAGVSGGPTGGQQSPSTTAPSPSSSGAEVSAAGERSAAAQPPAATPPVPGAQTAQRHSQTAGRQTVQPATSPGLRQRRAQRAAAEYQAELRGQELAEELQRNRLRPQRNYLNTMFRIMLGVLFLFVLTSIVREWL